MKDHGQEKLAAERGAIWLNILIVPAKVAPLAAISESVEVKGHIHQYIQILM